MFRFFGLAPIIFGVTAALLGGCSRQGGMNPAVLPAAPEAQSQLAPVSDGVESGAQTSATYGYSRSHLARIACQLVPEQPCRLGMPLLPSEVHVGPARLPATATGAVKHAKCRGNVYGEVCGTVSVPLYRAHPKDGSIDIFFALFTHTSYGPPESAIVFNGGGPGNSTSDPLTAISTLALVGADLDVHDLLLIDDRGEGLSGTIDCKPLQHGTGRAEEAVADCAAQLGGAASRYANGDVAQDVDAVRAALGYEKIDYYVWSWGGNDATAYATRFASHVRSLVLDSPAGVPDQVDYLRTRRFSTHAEPRKVRLACAYSPTCRVDHPDADAELARLVGEIRSHPLSGREYDANGNRVRVHVDETNLLFYILSGGGNGSTGYFVSTGEILAAARALDQKDPAPLLRLEAEAYFPFPNGVNYGNPTLFSIGAAGGEACADVIPPWSWKASPSARVDQYNDALAALPANYYAPFSKAAANAAGYAEVRGLCPWWELPTAPSRVTEHGAKFPDVPTLVLSGDMDDSVPYEEVSRVAAEFPRGTLVRVAASGHVVSGYSHCAAVLEARFVETLQIGNSECTETPETVYPAVGRFPIVAADARPAAVGPGGRNRVGVAERRAVTVAVAAALDALKRSTFGSGNDACLRAGSFTTAYHPAEWVLTLKDCSFSTDISVSGTVKWGARRSLDADLSLSGSGTKGGPIHVRGTFEAQGRVGNFEISGKLGGLNVALLVPEA
jgi:pimeloyl-ACP methyl ester carboxylesterase